jgi:hypothetical protein
MSTVWDSVSELQHLADLLFIPDIWVWEAKVEWYWQEKPKKSEKKQSRSHFVHHKSHMDLPGSEPAPPRWEADD